MAAILRDSTVVVAVVRTRPRAIPLSMINHEKIHTWVSFSYMVMGLRLAALRAAGAPLIIGFYVEIEHFSGFLCGPYLGRQKLQSRLYFKSSCGVLGKVFNQQ